MAGARLAAVNLPIGDLRRLLALLALVATLGLATGCGGDDEGGGDADKGQAETEPRGPDTTETEPEPAGDGGAKDPESAFLAFQNALADGDKEKVCGSLTPSAIKQVEEASIGGKCDTWVEEISGVYDPGSKEKLRKTKVDDVAESGNKATIKYTSPILNLPLEVELEKSGESWKISKLGENV